MNDLERLRVRCAGVRRSRLSEVSGVPESALSKILSTKTDPRFSTVVRLHAALDEMGVE